MNYWWYLSCVGSFVWSVCNPNDGKLTKRRPARVRRRDMRRRGRQPQHRRRGGVVRF